MYDMYSMQYCDLFVFVFIMFVLKSKKKIFIGFMHHDVHDVVKRDRTFRFPSLGFVRTFYSRISEVGKDLVGSVHTCVFGDVR